MPQRPKPDEDRQLGLLKAAAAELPTDPKMHRLATIVVGVEGGRVVMYDDCHVRDPDERRQVAAKLLALALELLE